MPNDKKVKERKNDSREKIWTYGRKRNQLEC